MWKRALRALNIGVEAAVSPQCRVPLQVRNSVSGLLVMHGLRRHLCHQAAKVQEHDVCGLCMSECVDCE